MDRREDQSTEELLSGYFETARAESMAPDDLWERVAGNIGEETPKASLGWRLPLSNSRRVAALAIAVALVAVFAVNPWSESNGTSPATDLLQRAYAAALEPRLVETVYLRVHIEDIAYENQSEPAGTPIINEVFHLEGWWASSSQWRFESSIEYFAHGALSEPQPGWLKGGITVADGTNVWSFTDIEPGEGEAPEDLSHPQTHVRPMNEYDELEPGAMFAFGGSSLTSADATDLANMLGKLEDCFDARLDGFDEIAGRETQVVRLVPRGVGERLPGVIDAGGCMAVVRAESSPSGERVAEQELTLWIDTEHFFILKVEQTVWYAPDDTPPTVLVSRSEVTELELNSAIPLERFEFTPPPNVPIVDER